MSSLTPSQQRALNLDKNISVTAGAGSGKTAVLVKRFLKIVLQDSSKVRRVLAITFTKKAAAEMRERVAEKINELLDEESEPMVQARLLRVRDQLNSAYISTIHSFCSSILHEFPLEAGLTPDFSEMDELRGEVARLEAVETAFSRLEEIQEGEDGDWLTFFTLFPPYRIRAALKEMLDKPYEMEKIRIRFGAMSQDEWWNFINELWLEIARSVLPEDNLVRFLSPVEEILRLSPQPGNIKGNRVYAILKNLTDPQQQNILDRYKNVVYLIKALTTGQGTAYNDLRHIGTRAGWPEPVHETILNLSQICADWIKPVTDAGLGVPPGEEDRNWFVFLQKLLFLYKEAHSAYERYKQEHGAVDYEDLLIRTLHLLRDNPDIRREVGSRFDYIMVDEFQDTNELQWEIIRLLAGDNDRLQSGKVFIVGDPKQSIYAFRNADVRVFKNVKNSFARQAGCRNSIDYAGNIVFEDSFRFLPRLNGFINYLFDRVLREESGNPFTVEYNALKSRRELPGRGEVEIALLDSEQPVKDEALYIARTINRLIEEGFTCYKRQDNREGKRPLEYGDIAVLLRSRTHLLTIEQTLRDLGIPFKTVSGIGFWQKQEIYDFYHVLRFLSGPDDDFALTAVLRSTFFMISDPLLLRLNEAQGDILADKLKYFAAELSSASSLEEERALIRAASQIEKWLYLRDRLQLDELLHILMDDLHLRAVLAAQINGEQLIANIEKLINSAQQFSASGAGGMYDFLYYMEDLMEKSEKEGEAQVIQEDDSTVKIITIHSAKGLQFPVVFVPYLNQTKSGRGPAVYLDPAAGLAVSPGREGGQSFYLYHHLKHLYRQKEDAERRRLFYVAVTRASNYLFLSAAFKEGRIRDNTPFTWLYDSFAEDDWDIQTQDEIEHADFRLKIVHQLPQASVREQKVQDFFEKIRDMEIFVNDYQPKPQETKSLLVETSAVVFSATRLMTYLRDKREYYRRYHLGFFEHDYEVFAQDVYESDMSLFKGKLIHRYLEMLDREIADRDALINTILFEYEVYEEDLRRSFLQEIKGAEHKIVNSAIGRRILQAEEARNEISVTIRLGEDFLTGSIDRLYRNRDGLWEVVDYKTNRIKPEALQREAQKYEWQMKTYALLVSRLYPEQKVYPVSLYFLHPDLLHTVAYSHTDIEVIEKDFLRLIRKIKSDFPPA